MLHGSPPFPMDNNNGTIILPSNGQIHGQRKNKKTIIFIININILIMQKLPERGIDFSL